MVDSGDMDLTLSRIHTRFGRGSAEGRVRVPWDQLMGIAELFTLEHPERFTAFHREFERCTIDVHGDGHLLDATLVIRLVNDRERSSRLLLTWTPKVFLLPTTLGAANRDLRDFVMLLGTARARLT